MVKTPFENEVGQSLEI